MFRAANTSAQLTVNMRHLLLVVAGQQVIHRAQNQKREARGKSSILIQIFKILGMKRKAETRAKKGIRRKSIGNLASQLQKNQGICILAALSNSRLILCYRLQKRL